MWRTDERYVWVDPLATVVEAGLEEWYFGSMLAAGHDLDKDGVLEWSVGAPSNTRRATVRIFEGTQELAERRLPDDTFELTYPTTLGRADFDGDSFADLGIGIGNGGLLNVVSSTSPSDDAFFEFEVAHGVEGHAAEPRAISSVGDAWVMGWWSAGWTGATGGQLPPGAGSSWEAPVPLAAAEYQVALVGDELDPDYSEALNEPLLIHHPNQAEQVELWFGMTINVGGLKTGRIWQCPYRTGLVREKDCTLIGNEDRLGVRLTSGDLDGDGWVEVASSGSNFPEDEGTVHVYTHDGQKRATIRGTQLAQLGARLHIAHDKAGEAWLLLGCHNWNGTVPASLYAFRGTDVVGELTDEDAERVYVSEIGSRFEAFEVYRETPDADPILLLGHPAASAVYMVSFDPGSPMKAETP